MNKTTFLSRLDNKLKLMGVADVETYLMYYDEMIEDYQEDGHSETEAVSLVGSIESIAQTILAEGEDDFVALPTTGNKSLNYLLLVLGAPLWGAILLAAILFVFSAYLLMWCLPIVIGSFSFAGLAIGVVSFVGAPFNSALFYIITQVGFGLVSLGLGLLLLVLTISISSRVARWTRQFTGKLINLFKEKVVQG